MATNRRRYPEDYFAWYNDDQRLGIVIKQTSSNATDGLTSGEYDTYTDSDVTKGLRIHFHSKYEEMTISSSKTTDLSTLAGLDSGMHTLLLDYIRGRLYEQMGDLQTAQYYFQKFEVGLKKYPSRKSGVRILTVPNL